MQKIAKELDVEYYIRKKGKKEYKMNKEEKCKVLDQVAKDALKAMWIVELALERGELYFKKTKHEMQLKEALDDVRRIFGDYIEEEEEGNEDEGDIENLDIEAKDGNEDKTKDTGAKYKPREKKGKDRIVSMVDKDVRWGAKSDKKIFAGFKAHITMTENGFLTDIEVTPGNVSDDSMAVPLVEHQKEQYGIKPKKMRCDGIYGTIDNRKKFNEIGIQLVAPDRTSHDKGEFPKEMFKLDDENGVLTCPAGMMTTVRYYNKGTKSYVYYFSKEQCGECSHNKKCTRALFRTVSIHEDFAIKQKAREYNATEDYKEDMKIRAHIEPKNAEMKRFHGLKRAIYRGLERVNIQAIYTAIVVNLKRLVTVLFSVSPQSKAFG